MMTPSPLTVETYGKDVPELDDYTGTINDLIKVLERLRSDHGGRSQITLMTEFENVAWRMMTEADIKIWSDKELARAKAQY